MSDRVKQVTAACSRSPASNSASRASYRAGSGNALRSRARSSASREVLLLDEPLSALDAKLRHSMQIELKRLQKKARHHFRLRHTRSGGGTDDVRPHRGHQPRAHRAARGGPSEIYHSPRTTFVANFIGQANILESTPMAVDANQARVRLNDNDRAGGKYLRAFRLHPRTR